MKKHSNQIQIFNLQKLDLQRRQALKDLAVLAFGGLACLKFYKDKKTQNVDTSYKFFLKNQAINQHSLFRSNAPDAILHLPLNYFSIPHHFQHILTQDRLRYKDEQFIISLVSEKYLDYTNYYLNMPIKHKNLDFFSYYYDNLASLIRDLEKKNFYLRVIDDTLNVNLIEELYILLQKNIIDINSYREYIMANLNAVFVIDSYHNAMNYLDDVYMGCFNTRLKDNALDLYKHRKFLRALNVIGENNIKALYVGIGEKQQSKLNSNTSANDFGLVKNKSNKQKTQQEKRPKLVGRLATTIIMKDGLYIG